MDDITTLRAQAREAARAEIAAQARMDELIPFEPMFDLEPISAETMDQWDAARLEREAASTRFVTLMRQLLALHSDRRGP
jgi:hypothetical protein